MKNHSNQAVTGKKYSLAEFVFSSDPICEYVANQSFAATGGVYMEKSTLRDINTNSNEYTYKSDERSIRNHGFYYNENNPVYWLVEVPTKNFYNITLSSQQMSSEPAGPRDFSVEISIDKENWSAIDIPGGIDHNGDGRGNLTLACYYQDSATLTDLALPAMAENQDTLYIRWRVCSDKNVEGAANIADESCRIRDIIIKGRTNSIVKMPPSPMSKSPIADIVLRPVNAKVTVEFNVPITIDDNFSASIKDEDNNALEGIELDVEDKVLTIQHPDFDYGKTYTVTIPKELVKNADDGTNLVKNLSWSFTTIPQASKIPSLLNMTFNGDTKTSIAFDWYTSTDITGTELQVIEYSKLVNGNFPSSGFITFSGTSNTIATYMLPEDQNTDNYIYFNSHKVTANSLKPGAKYAFRAGSGNDGEWGKVGSFSTDAIDNQAFHFIVTADPQADSKESYELWQDTLEKSIAKVGDPKFIAVTGDLSDAGIAEEYWQWCLGLPENVLTNVPIVPVVGNHESNEDCHANNNFYYHFNLPQDPGINFPKDTHDGTVYSFEYGNALFMVINTQYKGYVDENGEASEVDPQFTTQIEWMRNQVAKTDRKWKILLLHKGPYSASDNAHGEAKRVDFYKKFLVPVIDELGVDMVFQGHDHMYMRSYQMLNNEVQETIADENGNILNPDGTVYLMNGTAARKFYTKYPGYDDYFAAIDEQPEKKLFTDVSVTDSVLKFVSYTCAVDEDVTKYDEYSIKRTDTKPAKVTNAKVSDVNGKAVITWNAPSVSDGITEYRIYESNDNIKTNWSATIPAVKGQTAYTYTVDENLLNKGSLSFVIKAANKRLNSDPVTVYTEAFAKKDFSDIDSCTWAKKEISVLRDKGIINGTSNTTFAPLKNITRADFVTILIKTLGLTADVNSNFVDVKPGSYYYEAVGIAKKLGICEGTENNLFNPGAPITRQDMMALAARAMKAAGKLEYAKDNSGLEAYTDKGQVASYAQNAVATMIEEGLIKGSGNFINPTANTTRAEAAVLIYRIYNK